MTQIETKSVGSDAVIDEMHRMFGAFRETNDERLSQIERRLSSDIVTEEKLTRIDAALDDTRKRGFKIVPACSFVVDFVRRHREYDDSRNQEA